MLNVAVGVKTWGYTLFSIADPFVACTKGWLPEKIKVLPAPNVQKTNHNLVPSGGQQCGIATGYKNNRVIYSIL
jgi:hypothetical protein